MATTEHKALNQQAINQQAEEEAIAELDRRFSGDIDDVGPDGYIKMDRSCYYKVREIHGLAVHLRNLSVTLRRNVLTATKNGATDQELQQLRDDASREARRAIVLSGLLLT